VIFLVKENLLYLKEIHEHSPGKTEEGHEIWNSGGLLADVLTQRTTLLVIYAGLSELGEWSGHLVLGTLHYFRLYGTTVVWHHEGSYQLVELKWVEAGKAWYIKGLRMIIWKE
jgi:hypothetical protein